MSILDDLRRPVGDVRRDLWRNDFEVEHREMVGRDWPVVTVHKFQVNSLGERRYLDSRMVDLNRQEPVDG